MPPRPERFCICTQTLRLRELTYRPSMVVYMGGGQASTDKAGVVAADLDIADRQMTIEINNPDDEFVRRLAIGKNYHVEVWLSPKDEA